MRKSCTGVGVGVAAAGVSILLAVFLPASVMVCIEAVLLVAVGFLCFFGR